MNMKKGIILISAYAIIAILLLICGVTFVGRSINEKNIAERHKESTMGLYLAESGLDRALGWLRAQSTPPAGTAAFDPFGGSQNLGQGTYSVSIDPDNNNPLTTVKRYKIISTGTVNNAARQLVNEVQVDHYARFAYFSDSEHFHWYSWYVVPVWFITGDALEGPVQTNSHFHIKGNPVFNSAVSASDNFSTFYNNGNYLDTAATSNPPWDVPTFSQALTLGAPVLAMPSRALDLRAAATQGGLSLSGSTTVVLNSNGTMNVTNSQRHWNNQNMALPANGALFVTQGNLTISGTLNGQLNMGSERDIVLANDVTYANDPRTNPASTDMLGLISERDVVISQNAPYNVEVDASIMALGDSFIVENWWVGPAKGTLTVYGGMIQNERGPVGTFNGSTGQRLSGYSKDYHYDSRLVNSPPPYYPRTGDYISLCWEEQ